MFLLPLLPAAQLLYLGRLVNTQKKYKAKAIVLCCISQTLIGGKWEL